MLSHIHDIIPRTLKSHTHPRTLPDEKLPASILLKCPFAPEDAFKSFLQRLRVSLDVTAIADKSHHSPAPNRTSQPAPARDVLDSRIVEDPSQAEIAIYEEPSLDTDANDDDRTSTSSDHPSRSIFVLYKVSVHIARTRLQQTTHPSSPSPPSAYLSCTVLLSPAPRSPSDLTDPILPRNQATSHNVLSALQHDPTFASNNLTAPVLTAARLTKHTPPGDLFSPIDDSRPLKNVARRLMRLIPAVGTRLRVSRVGGSVSVARVLAGIDVDISPALLTSRDTEQDDKDPESEEDTVTLESIDVTLSHGTAVSLTHCNDKQKDVASLPRTCKARDILSLVYDLTPSPTYTADSSNDTPATTHKHTLYFRLTASITTNSSPTETKTRTKMKVERPLLTHWRTTLDLALLHRKLAPLALSPAAPKKPYSNHLVTVTVTAPERTRVGATLTWNVLVVNRAARPLRVAVLPLMSPPYVVDHMYDRDDVPTQEDDDGAVLRHGSERKQRGGDRTPDMIPLTPELRFPPLEPGTSAEGSLRFWITRVGALERCGVRVVEVDEGGRAMREGAKDGESKRSLRDLRDGGAGVGPAAGEGWIDVPRSCLPDVVAYPAAGEEG